MVKMIHLISANPREGSSPWILTLDPLGTWQSWECQHADPWQPPVPSAKDSVTSTAEKISTAQAGWLK